MKTHKLQRIVGFGVALTAFCLCWCKPVALKAAAGFTGQTDAGEEKEQKLLQEYEEYKERFQSIRQMEQIEDSGFSVIREQIFPIETQSYGMVDLVPAIEGKYHRLALFLVTESGDVVYKTEQLQTNYRTMGELRQPGQEISAVAFQDLNRDGLTDVVLITAAAHSVSPYNACEVGDVLFQSKDGFYRDYRISDKINRFGMNKSAECIIAFVRDGASTEFLYTATTKRELLQNGFVIAGEQNYPRQFEKLGYLDVVPGTYTIAEFSVFMIYLIDEQGTIVWSFQPMGDYDNLYALKGINCSDIDGDGMKDMIVLARYSYAGENHELVTVSDYTLYYQRTGGFYEDTQVRESVTCTEEETMAELIKKARAYWGWQS